MRRKAQRYIFKTKGVCAPEIHFQVDRGALSEIRFVGGGCPGHAGFVSQLLKGRQLDEVIRLAQGIECRNGTSCPDQLACAIAAVADGQLSPAISFCLTEDPLPKTRMGLIGELSGHHGILNKILTGISATDAEYVLCLGNVTGASDENREVLKAIRKANVKAIQGPNDWACANSDQKSQAAASDAVLRDWLVQLPQVVSFFIGNKKCMAFHGDFIRDMPGYSDFEPYALEMNMVCGLTDFMRDETVFPALEAMVPQFRCDVVIFGQTGQWHHWQVGGKDFISVGPAADLTWDTPYEKLPNTHPRVSGSYAKSLRLARENNIPLMQIIAMSSYNSAVPLGKMGLKAMQERGRMQKGMVADITIIDPEKVTDNATYEKGTLPSTGIPFVVVNGMIVVKDSKVLKGVNPGQPIRYEPVKSRFEPLTLEGWHNTYYASPVDFGGGVPGSQPTRMDAPDLQLDTHGH